MIVLHRRKDGDQFGLVADIGRDLCAPAQPVAISVVVLIDLPLIRVSAIFTRGHSVGPVVAVNWTAPPLSPRWLTCWERPRPTIAGLPVWRSGNSFCSTAEGF